MIHSSVNAPIKKGGAGGQFTWGNATDVGAVDYVPVGTAGMPSVSVVQAPVQVGAQNTVIQQPQAPMTYNLRDQSNFPALVPGPRPPPVVWGPPVPPVPAVIDPEAALRSGVVFDSTHPRNQFAKKPSVVSSEVVKATPPAAIDWSAQGLTGMQQQMVKAVQNNPAHLSIYAQAAPAAPAPSIQVLRQTPVAATHYVQPTLTKNNAGVKPTFIKPNMTQARAR